jgi:hypothetical protein
MHFVISVPQTGSFRWTNSTILRWESLSASWRPERKLSASELGVEEEDCSSGEDLVELAVQVLMEERCRTR